MKHYSHSDPDLFEQMVSELYGRFVLLAGFCGFALKERDLGMLMQTACFAARDGLQTEFVSVWQYRSDNATLVVEAGTGWQSDDFGHVWTAAVQKTAISWSWSTSQAASAGAAATGAMFGLSRLNEASGIHQAISVAIPAETGEPFGVLEVGCRHRSEFTDIEILFLQALASRLGAAIARHFGRIREEEWIARANNPRGTP